MKRMILILMAVMVLLSGCIGHTKPNENKTDSNKDEYADDGGVEQDDSNTIQEYDNLDMNNRNLEIKDWSNVTRENIVNKTTGNISTRV